MATNLLGYKCRDRGFVMYAVIYDGTCNLCVTLVRLLEQLDQGKQFQYVPMQQTATLKQWQISPQDCEQGMILLDQTAPAQRWQGSNAAEEIGRLLPLGNVFVQAYRSLPGAKASGDGFYAFIRDHRYALFGGREGVYESPYPACEGDQCAQF
ncbi:MAG: thiol-disulfide oxidoreductase DCC family protein [Leptolyngbyaceae cyanobacterium]